MLSGAFTSVVCLPLDFNSRAKFRIRVVNLGVIYTGFSRERTTSNRVLKKSTLKIDSASSSTDSSMVSKRHCIITAVSDFCFIKKCLKRLFNESTPFP